MTEQRTTSKKMAWILGTCLTLAIIISFGFLWHPTALIPSQYADYVSNTENGLRQQKQEGDLVFRMQYKPVDYTVVLETKTDDLTETEYEEIKQELDGAHYLSFSIGAPQKGKLLDLLAAGSDEAYGQLVQYLAVTVREDFRLTQGSDTLNCIGLHYERNYGAQPWETLNLAFDTQPESTEDLTLWYQDRLLGTGLHAFHIRQDALNNLPTLALK